MLWKTYFQLLSQVFFAPQQIQNKHITTQTIEKKEKKNNSKKEKL